MAKEWKTWSLDLNCSFQSLILGRLYFLFAHMELTIHQKRAPSEVFFSHFEHFLPQNTRLYQQCWECVSSHNNRLCRQNLVKIHVEIIENRLISFLGSENLIRLTPWAFDEPQSVYQSTCIRTFDGILWSSGCPFYFEQPECCHPSPPKRQWWHKRLKVDWRRTCSSLRFLRVCLCFSLATSSHSSACSADGFSWRHVCLQCRKLQGTLQAVFARGLYVCSCTAPEKKGFLARERRRGPHKMVVQSGIHIKKSIWTLQRCFCVASHTSHTPFVWKCVCGTTCSRLRVWECDIRCMVTWTKTTKCQQVWKIFLASFLTPNF